MPSDQPNENKTPLEPAGDTRLDDNTLSGDHTSGSIDKRQGNFVHGDVHGNVIYNEQAVIQAPTFAPTLHQLRAPVGDFVGREQEIAQMVAILSRPGAAAAISGLRGMGGGGKTELAFAVAQQLMRHFPDAQLLLELRGASDRPVTAAHALQTAIRAFEREATLPDDLAQLSATYRALLADKRILVLADDAKDAAHVRFLLPPPGCALLITSRTRFSLPGMTTVDLGMLPAPEAEQLLRAICPRIGDHDAELATLCGLLPLALRISASLLQDNPSRSVGRYLEQLRAERLRSLTDPDNPDDPQASVAASVQLSYTALSPSEQAALCQLSVFPASFDPVAALAVLAVEGNAEVLLETLQRRSLVGWDAASERYSIHDLVRAFAAARLTDANPVRLRHAQHYAKVAASTQNLYLRGNVAAGLALFDLERVQIDAGWAWARAQPSTADALLRAYADATGYVGDLRYDVRRERIPQLEAALVAARRQGHQGAEGALLGMLGNAYANLGETRRAIGYYEQSLAIMQEIGDRRGEGNVVGNMGAAYNALGETPRAVEYQEQALAIAREIGNRRGEGYALDNLGNAYTNLGETRRAIEQYEQRLAIAREIGDRRGEGHALNNLGNAYYDLGETPRAVGYYEQSLAIMQEIGDRRGEGHANWNLGVALEAQGNLARAADLMHACVEYERAIGHPDAEKDAARVAAIRRRLAIPPDDA